MIFDGIITYYKVEDYINDKKHRDPVKLVSEDFEKVLLTYFQGNYSDFIKLRKNEIYNTKSFSFIRKIFSDKYSLSFEDKSYQYSGFLSLLCKTPPIVRNKQKSSGFCSEAYCIENAHRAFCRETHFIEERTYNIFKSTWQPYIEYLNNLINENSELKLQKNIEHF